jgi:tRNA 2-thiouridine synthesizing protein B
MASKGDSILLIEDGVYAALANAEFANKITSRLDNFSFYVLGPDVAARGLGDTPLIGDISVVDYEGFVDLVADNEVTQSWL